MSRTTHVPRLVNAHVERLRQSAENFSVPARLPFDGVLAGTYGFFVDVILVVVSSQRFWGTAVLVLRRLRCLFRRKLWR